MTWRSTSRISPRRPSFVFDSLFPHVDDAPPTPVAKNAQAFYQWGVDNNYPPIGFYSAYPGLSVQDIRALLADRASHPATAGRTRYHMVTNRDPPGVSAVRSSSQGHRR